MALWITLDLKSETPLYMQIRDQVIEGVLTGGVKYGEELPSVRQLAQDLGINMLTVNKAYVLLKQEGFIRIHRQKGAVINPPEEFKADEAYRKKLRDAVRLLVVEAFCRGISQEEFLKNTEAVCSEFGKSQEGSNDNG